MKMFTLLRRTVVCVILVRVLVAGTAAPAASIVARGGNVSGRVVDTAGSLRPLK